MKTILKAMLASLAILATSLASSAFAENQDQVATTGSGQKVLLKEDGTWSYQKEAATSATGYVIPKSADQAVEVWDKQLTFYGKDVDNERFSNEVGLFLHYHNLTTKKVVGLIVFVRIKSPLGKVALEKTLEEETVLEPLERKKNEKYYSFKENQFMNDLPYNKLWEIAQNGTAIIETQIRKVVFNDGTVLEQKQAKTLERSRTATRVGKGN